MFTGTHTNTGWLCRSSFEQVSRLYLGEWKLLRRVQIRIMGTSRNLRESIVSFTNHVRLSLNSHETTRPPLEVFPWNFKKSWCVKSVEKVQFCKNQTNRGSTVTKHLQTFVTTLATGIVMTAVDSNRC